jgi:energy-coupling factor transport system ATP-binding protein
MNQSTIRSHSVLSTESSVLSTEAISLEQVSFTYADTTTPALREVSLQVRQGELLVIIGASGAGKSTLVKCLNRVIPAFQAGQLSGEVRLFGRRLVHEKVGELAGIVGMVFQDFEAQLFATTVRDEVLFGMEQLGVARTEMQHRLTEVLAQVGLHGYESRDPTTLSGGQKQRLAIAALLALRPQVLVLDEPTTDLDPQGRQEIFTLLAQMRASGHTLVLVEHDLAAATAADQIVLLAAGEIVAAGPPAQILPQIDTLERYGVRPRDVDRLWKTLDVEGCPRDLEEAVEVLRTWFTPLDFAQGGLPQALDEQTAEREELQQPFVRNPLRLGSQQALAKHDTSVNPPLLHLQSVTHVYPGDSPAVREVTLSIEEGEFIALLGQNGSGKTTVAKHLSGLLTPTQGQVFLRGQELRQVPLHRLAQEVSYVFQNPDHQLFADTVEEEVAFGPRNIGLESAEVELRVDEALAAVGLDSMRQYDPFLLGRGERQRLAVAALLALRPRVLILDEPTTGLDYLEQRRMMQLLRQLHGEGRTIIIITHAPWVAAEYAERALLMAQGQLLWDGPLRGLCGQTELCARASFRPPDVTLLGLRFGVTPLSVEEFAGWTKGGNPVGARSASYAEPELRTKS